MRRKYRFKIPNNIRYNNNSQAGSRKSKEKNTIEYFGLNCLRAGRCLWSSFYKTVNFKINIAAIKLLGFNH